MKKTIARVILIKNILGLGYILLYSLYVGLNLYFHRGNPIISYILLALCAVYLSIYIYSVFIEENKKMARKSKRNFKRLKRFIGFVNACLIIVSVSTNSTNSFWSIFLAVTSIVFYLIYLIFDLLTIMVVHEVKSIKNRWSNGNDNRD